MNVKKAVRYVSSAVALCAAVYVLIDGTFSLLAPAVRGAFLYVTLQIVSQGVLALLMATRRITIFR
jgi:hypothetical protein